MKYTQDDLTKRLDQGLKKAVADAIKRHKLLGQSIAVWRDGKVLTIPAEEIILPNDMSSMRIKMSSLEQPNWIKKFPQIAHYTTLAGLRGILETKQLWATHYRFLNDRSEIEHGKGYLREIWKEIVGTTKISLFPGFENFWWAAGFAPKTDPEFFVSSFTGIPSDKEALKKNGILSQWRGYGNNGGFAIVFDSAALDASYHSFGKKCKAHNEHDDSCSDCKIHFTAKIFDEVIYSHDLAMIQNHPDISIIKTHFDKFCTALNSGANIQSDPNDIEYYKFALYLMFNLKHQEFEEENEVRFSCFNRLEKFAGGYLNTSPFQINIEDQKPRLKIDFDPTAIKTIIVGPQKEQDQMQIYIKYFLENLGYLNVDVSKSEIPFIPI